MPKRSDIPEKILSILHIDPRATRQKIENELGVSYQTVQKHLSTMIEQELVVQTFTVMEDKIKNYLFFIFITTNLPDEEKKLLKNGAVSSDYQKELCNKIRGSFKDENSRHAVDGLIFAGVDIVIGGSPDIILRLYADNPNSVGKYVTQFLRADPYVISTSTAWSLKETDGAPEIERAGD